MRNILSSMVDGLSPLLVFATLSLSAAGCLDDSGSLTQATEVNYTGNITVSLRQPRDVAKNEFWMVMSAPEEAEAAALCLIIKTLDECNSTTGIKMKTFFPLEKLGVRGGRAFFKSHVSGYLTEGLILTFVYWVKEPDGSGYKYKDIRHVMYSKANGGTIATGPGTTPTAPSPASAGSVPNLDETVRSKCSGGDCHATYTRLADLQRDRSAAAAAISNGSMPKGRAFTDESEKAALLNALR